jgi:hypothetical protein
MFVVWRLDQIDQRPVAGTDVFDLSCSNAQRLFSTVKKEAAAERG